MPAGRKPRTIENLPPYDWGRGQFMEPKASPANPDMSKMPAMKPMASHPQPSRQTSKPIAPIAPRSTRGKR